ncbi:MAG TPA: LysR family transcriptional regulator [Acetobacteraceae bacterium]|nr:LysR family transcriptional regulator [Acetobacteraceae bacterium]
MKAARQPAMHAAVLRYLKEVARRGSIRKAADVLHVASSAINRQILKLEADLGVRLFDRMPDGMHLTPAGDVLLRHVRDTLYNFDRLLAEIDELRGLRSGHVRIASLDSLLVDFLPRVLGAFSARHPAITFSVQAMAPMAVFDAIVAAEADLGLTFVAPASPAVGLAASVPMPIGAVMAASHPLAGRQVLAFGDFAGHRVLLQQETLPGVPFIDDDYAVFRSSVQPRFVSNSIEMLRHVIRAGLGVAFFTRLGFLREIESGELVWVALASARLERLQLGLFTPAQRTPSPASLAITSELTARLQELERG